MNRFAYITQKSFVAAALGLLVGVVVTAAFLKTDNMDQPPSSSEPLYWVAPMDSNYRRDKPGKSPMGMDLVPVYDRAQEVQAAGTVTISSSMVNNLGVRTTVVEKKTIKEEVLTVGYVKYDETKLIHIHPRVSGWIDELFVKTIGDPVEKGEPLYSLYSPELVNAQEEYVLALKSGNAGLIGAAEDRLMALQIAPDVVEKLKRDKKVNQTITFHSPQKGFVDNLNIRTGFYVQPGTTLFSIGALDSVWVEVEVLERQASIVSTGTKAVMTLDYLPGTTWHSQVDYVYPTLDEKTRTLRLRLKFDNPDQLLLPNMFARVSIQSNPQEPVLVIPSESLIRTGDQDRVVLALGEGRFKSIEVEAGREGQSTVEVIRGLNVGDRVVSSAQFLLDSESSKTSDFMRLSKVGEHGNQGSGAKTMGSTMDHSTMDHSKMDHSKMNHSGHQMPMTEKE